MSKIMKTIAAVVIALACGITFMACGGAPATPTPVDITLGGMKTEFAYGEAFATGELAVTVKLSDGGERAATADEYTVDSSAYKANVAGEYNINVKLKDGDVTKAYKVTVAPDTTPVPVDITLDGMKTEFAYGAGFSKGELTVTVKLSDGSERAATADEYNVDFSAYRSLVAGEYPVYVSLKTGNIKKEYKVTVLEQPQYSWEDDEMLQILMIGNSFSDDTMQYAYDIATSLGVKGVYLGVLYIGGCSLDTHAANAAADKTAYDYRVNSNGRWVNTPEYKMSTALASRDWDFVSLQQASPYSGQAETYGKTGELITYVRKNLPATSHAKIIWNMTWAYQTGCDHWAFANYNSNQAFMYSKIIAATQTKIRSNKSISAIVPAGTAIQNARSSKLGDTLNRDGYHLTMGLGRYIAGLTLVHTLTGLAIDDVAFAPSGVSASEKAIAIESAVNAVKTPYSVTESQYKE